MMEEINDVLYTYLPCVLCWSFGYVCCPFTLGLSFCCPAVCVNDAEERLREIVEAWNRKKFKEKGMKMSFHK